MRHSPAVGEATDHEADETARNGPATAVSGGVVEGSAGVRRGWLSHC